MVRRRRLPRHALRVMPYRRAAVDFPSADDVAVIDMVIHASSKMMSMSR